jgi:hypothetical protein
MKILAEHELRDGHEKRIAKGVLLQDAPEFWLNSNPSQLKAKDALGLVARLPEGPMLALGIGREFRGRFHEGQFGRRHAGFHESFAVMGDVSRIFPTEIPQVPFDGQAGIVAEQDFGRHGCFLASSRLRQRRRPYREHLKMIGIRIQRLARPGQRGIILSQEVVAECVQCRPLIAGIAIAALHGG